jgi:hypothetical protein
LPKRALKHAALAAALLLPTLAGIAVAPAAHATSLPYTYSPFRGMAKVDTFKASGANTTEVDAAAYMKPAGYATCAAAPEEVDASWGNDTDPWKFAPGDSATLCLGTLVGWSGSKLETWSTATVTIYDSVSGATALGSGVTITNTSSNDGQITDVPFHFDSAPIDGTNQAARAGSYEMVVSLTTTSTCTTACDSRGNGAGSDYAQGYVDASNGIMAGEDPSTGTSTAEASMETDETVTGGPGKVMPITRAFNTSLSAPAAGIATLAKSGTTGHGGRLVVYSFSPKTYVPTTGHSAWYDIANGTLDTSLTTWLTTLATDATASGAAGQMLVTISHEPHDNASDVKGCTVNTTTCFGSALEFRAMLTHLHALIATMGKSSILKTIYIATDWWGTTYGNDGVVGGPSVIGGGDTMYPGNTNRKCNLANTTACASGNVDYLGVDTYNYYQYDSTSAPPNYHNGTWAKLTDKLFLNDGTRSYGVIPLAKRLNKQVIIPELGSHPGCLSGDTQEGCNLLGITLSNETRDNWFEDGLTSVERSTDALQYLLGFAYFHKQATWNWEFINDSVQTLDTFHQRGAYGWQTLIKNNPLYRTTPLSL